MIKPKKSKRRGRPKGSVNKKSAEERFENIPESKQKLIKAIWKIRPEYKELGINLTKYNEVQLEKHLKRIKEEGQS